LSTASLPSLYACAPHVIQAFFTDPLPTTTITAVVLNQILNLDIVLGNLKKKNVSEPAKSDLGNSLGRPCPYVFYQCEELILYKKMGVRDRTL